jgi:hypothetical protein
MAPERRVGDETRGDLDDVAAALLLHLGDGELRDVEEPGEVDTQDGSVVGLGILGEGFGDEDAGVVDERVDTTEPAHAFGDCPLRRFPVGDVAGDGENIVVIRLLDGSRGRNHSVVALAIRLDESGADSLRCARDDCNFPFSTHGNFPFSELRHTDVTEQKADLLHVGIVDTLALVGDCAMGSAG